MPQLTAHHQKNHGEKGLHGIVKVAGDKSISHRAIILSALSIGKSQIKGLLEGDDVLATAAAFRALGVKIERAGKGEWQVNGVGLGGLQEASQILDMGNSGTAMRLMMGVLAGQSMRSFLSGDHSLNKRPMRRVSQPLTQMGAKFFCRQDEFPPMMIEGRDILLPIRYEMKLASAQIKSAVMLAALNAKGISEIIEPVLCRDHSERMLAGRGADINIIPNSEGSGRIIQVRGQVEMKAVDITVPGDPSSAAFLLVAALITPNSKIVIEGVGLNPTRTGLLQALKLMRANLDIVNIREVGGESVGDIHASTSILYAIDLKADIAPSMIDEYPILAIAAANAVGKSRFEGLAELKVKESDRLQAIHDGLIANQVSSIIGEDWIEIEGQAGKVNGGGMVKTHFDHRIAMSFLIMGLASISAVTIDDESAIKTSFPEFISLMTELGASFLSPA